jgi:hypothetical protein
VLMLGRNLTERWSWVEEVSLTLTGRVRSSYRLLGGPETTAIEQPQRLPARIVVVPTIGRVSYRMHLHRSFAP